VSIVPETLAMSCPSISLSCSTVTSLTYRAKSTSWMGLLVWSGAWKLPMGEPFSHRHAARAADHHDLACGHLRARHDEVEVACALAAAVAAAFHRDDGVAEAQLLGSPGESHLDAEGCGSHLRERGVRLLDERACLLGVLPGAGSGGSDKHEEQSEKRSYTPHGT
jgi:hypothetical protein